jgi:hypothetical protein
MIEGHPFDRLEEGCVAMPHATDVNRRMTDETRRLYAQAVGPVYRANVAIVYDKRISAADVDRWIAAMYVQLERHLEPVWSVGAHLFPVPAGRTLPKCWQLALKTNASSGIAGEHDKPLNGQLPSATVSMVKGETSLGHWGVTASHELLEMLVNPHARTVAAPRLTWLGGRVRMEVCDPCGDAPCYTVNGVKVANFVYRSWFGEGEGPFDHLGELPRSFSVTAGGSITVGESGNGDELEPDKCPELARRSGLKP